MSMDDYMPLTAEDKILGRTEPRKKTELEKNAFNHDYMYLINDKDMINGTIIGNILPLNLKREFMNGREEIEYKGMKIKRIGDNPEKKPETPKAQTAVRKRR